MSLENLVADGPIAYLKFRTGGTSKMIRQFINELSAALTAGDRKPLVCTNDRELIAVFRFYQTCDLRNDSGTPLSYTGGLRFADAEQGYAGAAHLGTEGASVTHGCDIEIPAGGRWLNNMTPDSTARHVLAVFDSTRVSQLVMALFDRWADRLVDAAVAPTRAPRPSGVEPQYSGRVDISNPVGDWDPLDPRRRDRTFVEKVKAWRKKILGGKDRGEYIAGEAGQIPRAEFDAD
jgi:hypothetical protein